MAEITYSPDSLVWTVRATLVDWLVSVTVTPGTASPLASVTMPLISPDGVCPRTGIARVKTKRRTTPEARLRIADLPALFHREHPHRAAFRHFRVLAGHEPAHAALHRARVDPPPGLHGDVLLAVDR